MNSTLMRHVVLLMCAVSRHPSYLSPRGLPVQYANSSLLSSASANSSPLSVSTQRPKWGTTRLVTH
ncbi:hypothetical protein AZE42_11138 [Rhizopogon vesiculosus]|uniref:Uncharacterized protein n=1 Tax=Rhizopogon vesiculosus TaxID=180088 RepID=A0A1J8PKZ0_9AGAM|nr:hypothetical protein AZE42_11138 [Rhizopogon vesiculosus]